MTFLSRGLKLKLPEDVASRTHLRTSSPARPGPARVASISIALQMTEITDAAAPFCSLPATDLPTRLGWIAQLNSRHLRATERRGQTLVLTYDQSAASEVHEMVSREKACCPSISFSVAEDHDSVTLCIAVPGDSGEQADGFLSLFAIRLDSNLTCPACGFTESLAMPTNACTFFHECAACRVLLRPVAGDCCVFCSYGDIPCPPVQAAESGTKDATCCKVSVLPTQK